MNKKGEKPRGEALRPYGRRGERARPKGETEGRDRGARPKGEGQVQYQ